MRSRLARGSTQRWAPRPPPPCRTRETTRFPRARPSDHLHRSSDSMLLNGMPHLDGAYYSSRRTSSDGPHHPPPPSSVRTKTGSFTCCWASDSVEGARSASSIGTELVVASLGRGRRASGGDPSRPLLGGNRGSSPHLTPTRRLNVVSAHSCLGTSRRGRMDSL